LFSIVKLVGYITDFNITRHQTGFYLFVVFYWTDGAIAVFLFSYFTCVSGNVLLYCVTFLFDCVTEFDNTFQIIIFLFLPYYVYRQSIIWYNSKSAHLRINI